MRRITLTNVPFITFTIGHLSYLVLCSLDCVEELFHENTPTPYPVKALGDFNKKSPLLTYSISHAVFDCWLDIQ
jgi:hypothetical protein